MDLLVPAASVDELDPTWTADHTFCSTGSNYCKNISTKGPNGSLARGHLEGSELSRTFSFSHQTCVARNPPGTPPPLSGVRAKPVCPSWLMTFEVIPGLSKFSAFRFCGTSGCWNSELQQSFVISFISFSTYIMLYISNVPLQGFGADCSIFSH